MSAAEKIARLTDDQIERAQAFSIASIASERGLTLKKQRAELIGPCPHCGGTDRFAINRARQLFNCRGCGGKGHGAISFVMFLDGLNFRQAVLTLNGESNGKQTAKAKPAQNPESGPVSDPPTNGDAKQRCHTEMARRIWRAARDPRGTLAEKYLNSRRLELPADLCGRVLRFHPRCLWGNGETVPALIAAFRPITEPDDDAPPVAIQRIGLNADGTKIDKWMLGPVGGAAIKLDTDESVSHGLGIAEGLETTLAIRATGWQPIWSLGSAGAIERFAPLSGIECLTVFSDHDQAGLAAAQVCAERWQAAGREVFIRWPNGLGRDYADGAP